MTYREQAEAAQDHDINDNDCRKHHEPLYSGWCKACAATAIERAVADTIPRATTQPFTPDWSLSDAAADSLCEHMAALKAAQESERAFREQVAAALEELRAELVADADAMATHGSGTSSCTIEDAFDATIAALGLDGRIIESRIAKCYDCGEDFDTYDEFIPDGGMGRCDDCAESERYEEMEAARALGIPIDDPPDPA